MQGARSNAEEARLNAHEAQEKYAEQASQDADSIRRKANETKAAAHQLRGEADHLNGRVVVTENRISKLGDAVKEDNALTDEAKEKVISIDTFTFALVSIELTLSIRNHRLAKQNLIRKSPPLKWRRHWTR